MVLPVITYVYVRVPNTRQRTSLRVLSTPYVYVRRKNAALEINPYKTWNSTISDGWTKTNHKWPRLEWKRMYVFCNVICGELVFTVCWKLVICLGLFEEFSIVYIDENGWRPRHLLGKSTNTAIPVRTMPVWISASAFSRSLRGLNSDPSCALNSILCSKLSGEKCMEQRRHAIVGVKSFLFINLTHSLHLFSSLGNVKRLKPDFEQVLQLKAAQNTVLKLLMFWYRRI